LRPDEAAREYVKMLLETRRRAVALTSSTVQRMARLFEQSVGELTLGVASGAITKARGEALRAQAVGMAKKLMQQAAAMAQDGTASTVSAVEQLHRDLVASVEKGANIAGMAVQFDTLATGAMGAVVARSQNAALFKTLMNRHVTGVAPELDDLIATSVERGVSSETLATDVARLIGGAEIDYAAYGIIPSDVVATRTLWSDARMIAVSEINNALREANALASAANRMVKAVQWQMSGAHPRTDACDTYAETDFYGLGAGWYDPRQWPAAPHPQCGCYQGSVELRPAAEWMQPKGPAPELLDEPRGGATGVSDREKAAAHAIVRLAA
jgi:hypothetical protein